MPTYEYACTICGEQLEVVQSFTDEPLTDCPSCAGRLRKVFSPVGVVFKGSGFYKTDSRSRRSSSAAAPASSAPAAPAASGDSAPASASAAASAESKPAAPAKSGSGDAPAA